MTTTTVVLLAVGYWGAALLLVYVVALRNHVSDLRLKLSHARDDRDLLRGLLWLATSVEPSRMDWATWEAEMRSDR